MRSISSDPSWGTLSSPASRLVVLSATILLRSRRLTTALAAIAQPPRSAGWHLSMPRSGARQASPGLHQVGGARLGHEGALAIGQLGLHEGRPCPPSYNPRRGNERRPHRHGAEEADLELGVHGPDPGPAGPLPAPGEGGGTHGRVGEGGEEPALHDAQGVGEALVAHHPQGEVAVGRDLGRGHGLASLGQCPLPSSPSSSGSPPASSPCSSPPCSSIAPWPTRPWPFRPWPACPAACCSG